jgi:hypothetical protein
MTSTQLLEDMILSIEVGSQFFTRTWQALRMSLGKPETIQISMHDTCFFISRHMYF